MFQLEDTHWWFQGKRLLVESWIKDLPLPVEARVLDAGCGTGGTHTLFAKFGKTYGVDFSTDALKFCSRRGIKNLTRGSVNQLPFKKHSFDLISALDLLYHKKVEDIIALGELYRVLKPHGYLIITDSAFSFLKSSHDQAVHGKKRYTIGEIKIMLEKHNYKVIKSNYFWFLIFPIIFTKRLMSRFLPSVNRVKSDLKETPVILNNILISLLKWEIRGERYFNYPWGSSLICLAKKNGH